MSQGRPMLWNHVGQSVTQSDADQSAANRNRPETESTSDVAIFITPCSLAAATLFLARHENVRGIYVARVVTARVGQAQGQSLNHLPLRPWSYDQFRPLTPLPSQIEPQPDEF